MTNKYNNCFYQLRNIAKLDYCNSFFTCLSKTSQDHLQVVQNFHQVFQKSLMYTNFDFFTLASHQILNPVQDSCDRV